MRKFHFLKGIHQVCSDSSHPKTRFVILWHELPPNSLRANHFDLMLEWEDQLITWEMIETPNKGDIIPLLLLQNHRKKYLDFEGTLSGSRGTVRQIFAGEFEWISPWKVAGVLAGERESQNQRLEVELFSETLSAYLELWRSDEQSPREPNEGFQASSYTNGFGAAALAAGFAKTDNDHPIPCEKTKLPVSNDFHSHQNGRTMFDSGSKLQNPKNDWWLMAKSWQVKNA